MGYIIYGDIHGCLDEFKELRKEINAYKHYEIVIGDFLDKGPYSIETLRYLKENKILSVLGNHEYKFLRKYLGKKVFLNEQQQELLPKFREEDFEYIMSLPFFIKINHLTVVHAGITNNMMLNNCSLRQLSKLLFIREVDEKGNFLPLNHNNPNAVFWADAYDGHEGFIVYGHSAFLSPKKHLFSLGIDTGCVYGNKLSAVLISDTLKPYYNKVISVPAKKKYVEPIFALT